MQRHSVLAMRILHTSDWHIGRTFHGEDLLPDQEAALVAVADLVTEHAVDVVVVAGDIYDRGVPSPEAVQVATRALIRIRQAGATIIASSGNHDSAPRLGAFAEFLAAGGLYLRTSVAELARPILLADSSGPVVFYAVPYLEPEIARHYLGVPAPARHQAVMSAAMDLVRRDASQRPSAARKVVLAHAFVVGGSASGSERSIAVGGVESVGSDVFEGIDYVALGHLHGPQQITGRIRYSGSPLPYSFAESTHRKGVWIVDLGPAGEIECQWAALPIVRPLAAVRGTLSEVLGSYRELVDHYLSVTLTDPVRPLDAMRRLRETFPHALVLAWEPPNLRPEIDAPAPGERLVIGGVTSDLDTVDSFLVHCRLLAATHGERSLVEKAITAGRVREAAE